MKKRNPKSKPATRTRNRPLLTGQQIDAMTPAQRQKLIDDLDHSTPERRRAESTPLSAEDQTRLTRAGRQLGRGRPKLGKGTRIVSVSVEVDLLERADAYARKAGLKRAELFTQGLKCIVP
jgi:hypothetical protein